MPRYKDAPLKEGKFRLFKIKPSPLDDLELEVQTFTLSQSPRYEAISYTWGDQSQGVTTIKCNNEPLEVWQNLYSVLCRLQREMNTSWLWNDAICIEQTGEIGEVEKARQIAFMEVIFPAAEPVKIWLGEGSEEEEAALESLVDICKKRAQSRVHYHSAAGFPEGNDGIWLLWAQILIRPWFHRLWIVQEALLTREIVIMFGSKAVIPWDEFLETVQETGAVDWCSGLKYHNLDSRAQETIKQDFLAEYGEELELGSFNVDQLALHHIIRNYGNIRELRFLDRHADRILQDGFFHQILKVYGNRRCAYDHDRPNAMRGVLPKHLKKGLKVYGMDAEVATVYREVSMHWLKNDPPLSLLHRVRPIKKFLPTDDQATASKIKNPSWTLDLSRVLLDSIASDNIDVKDGFHAGLVRHKNRSGKDEWTIPHPSFMSLLKGSNNVAFPTEKEFQVSGVKVGSITSALEPCARDRTELLVASGDVSVQFRLFGEWMNATLKLIQDTTPDETQAIETHWRALVHNRANVGQAEVETMFDIDNKFSRKEPYDNLMRIIRSGDVQRLREADNDTRNFYHLVHLQRLTSRHWYTTHGGLIGRSYAVPQAGDVVAIFYGAATPFLLRPVNGQPTFEFMGEAYVHGVMQGEALANSSPYVKEVFTIV